MELKNKKNFYVFIGLLFILVILYGVLEFNGWFTSDADKKIVVESGDGFYKVTNDLKKNDIIGSKIFFKIYAKIFEGNQINDLKPGELSVHGKISYKKLLDELSSVRAKTISVTIPEGFELREIADLLVKNNLVSYEKFYDICKNYDFDYPYIKELKKTDNRLEGFLFPDTYTFYLNEDNEVTIINAMLKRFDEIYKKYENNIKKNKLSLYEIVTLASIIEREAMYSDDFYNVSSVFHNRLNRNDNLSYLQSCATVQYILKERKNVLSISDTKIDSPYNTYKYSGLPVGPISSPGEFAIKAALNPNKTDYLFFLNDKDGKLHFSKTYSEHMKLERKYVGN